MSFDKPGFRGHIGEGPVAVVVIQHDPAETTDQKVRPSVVGYIRDRRSHRPAWIADAGFVGDVGKRAVMIVVIQRAFGLLPGKRHRNAGRVRKVNVQPAIAVIVEERHAAAHRFDDVSLFRTGKVLEVNSRGCRNILQLWRRARPTACP